MTTEERGRFSTLRVFHPGGGPGRGCGPERMNCPTCSGIGELLIAKIADPSRVRDRAHIHTRPPGSLPQRHALAARGTAFRRSLEEEPKQGRTCPLLRPRRNDRGGVKTPPVAGQGPHWDLLPRAERARAAEKFQCTQRGGGFVEAALHPDRRLTGRAGRLLSHVHLLVVVRVMSIRRSSGCCPHHHHRRTWQTTRGR